jgi:hypothetical protein
MNFQPNQVCHNGVDCAVVSVVWHVLAREGGAAVPASFPQISHRVIIQGVVADIPHWHASCDIAPAENSLVGFRVRV